MVNRIATLVAAGALSACATGANYEASDIFIDDVSVVDVRDGQIERAQTIIVRDGDILDIQPSSDVIIPDGATVAASGGYAIPGLWDMHAHGLSDPDDAIDRVLPLFLQYGVTSYRDLGSLLPGIAETKQRLAADETLLAPDFYYSGPLLDGAKLPWYGDLPLVLKTEEDVARELPKLMEAGVDFFKVYDQLPQPAFEAVMAFAEAEQMQVAGHPPKPVGLTGAAKAGIDSIEHMSLFTLMECVEDPEMWFSRAIGTRFESTFDGYYITVTDFAEAIDWTVCDGAFDAMAEAGTWFVPTLVMEFNDRGRLVEADLIHLRDDQREWCDSRLAAADNADASKRDAAYSVFTDILQRMRDAGVGLLAGSDTQNNCLVPGASLHLEMAVMVDVGMSPLEALRSATLHPAEMMGEAARKGQVMPGFAADIVILENNPLEDIANTRSIKAVMKDGRLIDATAP